MKIQKNRASFVQNHLLNPASMRWEMRGTGSLSKMWEIPMDIVLWKIGESNEKLTPIGRRLSHLHSSDDNR